MVDSPDVFLREGANISAEAALVYGTNLFQKHDGMGFQTVFRRRTAYVRGRTAAENVD